MEQKIYDVLCDIHKELSNLRADMADVKLELKHIQGFETEDWEDDDFYPEEYKSNLYTIYSRLGEIQSDVSDIHSSVSDIQSDVSDIQSSVSDIQSDVSDIQSDVSDIQSDL